MHRQENLYQPNCIQLRYICCMLKFGSLEILLRSPLNFHIISTVFKFRDTTFPEASLGYHHRLVENRVFHQLYDAGFVFFVGKPQIDRKEQSYSNTKLLLFFFGGYQTEIFFENKVNYISVGGCSGESPGFRKTSDSCGHRAGLVT